MASRYTAFLCFVILLCVYLDVGNYLSAIRPSFLPKYLYFLLIFFSVPVVFDGIGWFIVFLKRSNFVLFLAFASINLIYFLSAASDGNERQMAVILTRVQFYFLSFVCAFVVWRVTPRLVSAFCLIISLVLVSLQVVDFFNPDLIVPSDVPGYVLGRAASTLLNANKAPESLLILGLMAVPVVRFELRLVYFSVLFLGVIVSFSRSGMLAWFVCVVGLVLANEVKRGQIFLLVVGFFSVAAFSSFVFDSIYLALDASSADNAIDRILFFSTFSAADDSANARLLAAEHGWALFISHPFFGGGAGAAVFDVALESIAPHNMHLLMLAEYGVFGYLFLFFVGLSLWRGGGFWVECGSDKLKYVFFAVAFLYSFFSHNILDFPYWLLSVALFSVSPTISRC